VIFPGLLVEEVIEGSGMHIALLLSPCLIANYRLYS